MRTAVMLGLSLCASASAILAQTDTIPTLPTEALIDSGPPAPIRETSRCTIRQIIDGDTVECTEFGRVRLIGMDTPELSQEPYGTLATEALAALAPVGSRVELERDAELQDQYGRMLAYVWVEGLQVNWALVRQGWAVLLTYPPNVHYVEWYTDAQRQAREDGLGLWAIDGFDCPPVDRRRGRCD
jgi:micrococcal nuclease